jgi:catechol 2,3-dioxygenase-like lactoylglutathione lyase family enzyme
VILNHLNLAVADVQETKKFLVKYSGLDLQGKPGNDNIAIVRDDNGMMLTLSSFSRAEVKYTEAFHTGFIQEDPERVDETNRCLKAGGFEVDLPQRLHSARTFYFRAPGSFVIEVLA